MYGIFRMPFRSWRLVHTWSQDGPSETLKTKVAKMQKMRKKKNPKDEFIVYVPESKAFLDTLTMPMVLTAVAVALFAKVLMMSCYAAGISWA
uniref:Uncharacterized protein n=1 Tax=Nelumbo nucifera TaxID=4432 RepID=A0A822YD36_NELNU|nr:TPA_asm: hypothetical protein HUJ06_009238 [Nelumbo nucifera]